MKSAKQKLPLPRWMIFLLIVLAVTSFASGFYGFSIQEFANGDKLQWLDALYRSLELFFAHGGDIPNPNAYVQFARFGAFLASASGIGILASLWYWFQRGQMYIASGHVVICGLGNMGLRFALQFRQRGNKVVVIEKSSQNSAVNRCRDEGIHVLIGDASDAEVLDQANATSARLVLCLANDEGNLDIADRLASLASLHSRSPQLGPLQVFLHLSKESLLLRKRLAVFRDNSGRYERTAAASQIARPVVDVFNMYELAARLMLDSREHPFLAAGEVFSKREILAFVGWDSWNQAILLEAINRWRRSDNQKAGKKLTVFITHDDKASLKEVWQPFLKAHESLREMCDVRGVDETNMIAKLNDQSLLFISLPRDSDSCRYARTYCQPSAKLPCPAILAIKESWSPGVERQHALLYVYQIQDQACMPANLIGTVDLISRTIHEQYLRDQVRAGFALGSKPAMKSWEELDPTFRTSSNFQAASIVGNLQQSGYDLEAMTSLGQAYVDIDKEDVVPLAQREHERYCQERVLTGSAAANCTWEQLKEGDRNTTCDQVRSWPWILAQQGILLKKRNRR